MSPDEKYLKNFKILFIGAIGFIITLAFIIFG